jgi:hypothetical protein
MGYLLTPKAIEIINRNLNLKLEETNKDFNILIYIFEHYDEYEILKLNLDFYMLLKFYGHVEYFMILDFIKYLSRKIINSSQIVPVININPFINSKFELFSDILENDILNTLPSVFESYYNIITNRKVDFTVKDYKKIYEIIN